MTSEVRVHTIEIMLGVCKYVQFEVRGVPESKELSYIAMLVYCGTPLPKVTFDANGAIYRVPLPK